MNQVIVRDGKLILWEMKAIQLNQYSNMSNFNITTPSRGTHLEIWVGISNTFQTRVHTYHNKPTRISNVSQLINTHIHIYIYKYIYIYIHVLYVYDQEYITHGGVVSRAW